ncbi:uncharacterized protein B0I36DRAFT_334560 [Microdochium trichocladiopsis]|uniref:Chromo domain-containing protein n=1 Tax=Microdochium trichocladiopsis TaxID=1682393 RepID=A0A9P8XWM9_9PEZI|nr:uncharacterized protein B0I36DRAFT_334560 [Microdochium trichocladiopsis]KAH7021514.1 hypothetical protein B0I36DRAFT_334560 [Microdochium trichocladiopsis]
MSDEVYQEDFSSGHDPTVTQSHSTVTSPCGHPWPAGTLAQRTVAPELGHQQHTGGEQMAGSKSSSGLAGSPPRDTGIYEEWPLLHGVFKRITFDDHTEFQAQCTWNNTDGQMAHGSWPLQDARVEYKGDGNWTVHFSHRTQKRRYSSKKAGGAKKKHVVAASANDKTYPVDRILEKWGRDTFLLQWGDGAVTWELRENIPEALTSDFEQDFKGFACGIEILGDQSFKQNKRRIKRYRVKWSDGKVSWLRGNQIGWKTYKARSCSSVTKQ